MLHAPLTVRKPKMSHHGHYRHFSMPQYVDMATQLALEEKSNKKCKEEMVVRVGFMFNIDNASFVIEKFLGKGTFGRVVGIKNCATGQQLAMKIIKDEAAYRKQGLQEMRILREINQHSSNPRLLSLTGYCELLGQLCLIFPRYKMTLFQLLHKNKGASGFKINRVAHIAKQLIEALVQLKSLNIIHSDIKPDNIMIRNNPTDEYLDIVLIDFGSASHVGSTSANQYIQSRFYRAPEVILGLKFDSAIDMWSTGCVIVELLFGRPLYPGEDELDQISKIASFQGKIPTKMAVQVNHNRVHKLFTVAFNPYDGETLYLVKKDHVHLYWWEDSLRSMCLKENLPLPLPTHKDSDSVAIRSVFTDFVEGLLQVDPDERWAPEQIRNHPFLSCDWSGQMPFIPDTEKCSGYYGRNENYLNEDYRGYGSRDHYASVHEYNSSISSQFQYSENHYPTRPRHMHALNRNLTYDMKYKPIHETYVSSLSKADDFYNVYPDTGY